MDDDVVKVNHGQNRVRHITYSVVNIKAACQQQHAVGFMLTPGASGYYLNYIIA